MGEVSLDFEGLVGFQQEVMGHRESEDGTQSRQQELHDKGHGGWTVWRVWAACELWNNFAYPRETQWEIRPGKVKYSLQTALNAIRRIWVL